MTLNYTKCLLCHGTGRIPCVQCNGQGCDFCKFTRREQCLSCFGSGKKLKFPIYPGIYRTDHRTDHRTHHRTDHRTDHRTHHRTDHRTHHRTDHRTPPSNPPWTPPPWTQKHKINTYERNRVRKYYQRESEARREAAKQSKNSFLNWLASIGLTKICEKLIEVAWDTIVSFFALSL